MLPGYWYGIMELSGYRATNKEKEDLLIKLKNFNFNLIFF